MYVCMYVRKCMYMCIYVMSTKIWKGKDEVVEDKTTLGWNVLYEFMSV